MAEQQFVVFHLGKEPYAVDIHHVNSVTEPLAITEVPNTDPWMEGVINLRGGIIPIVNLKKRFKFSETTFGTDARIIIYQAPHGIIGYYVDEASRVIHIEDTDIDPTPAIIQGIDREFITGIGKVNGEIIILLNLNQMTEAIADKMPDDEILKNTEGI